MLRSTILLFLFISFSPPEYSPQHLIEYLDQDIFSSPFPPQPLCLVLSVAEDGIICKTGEVFGRKTLFLSFPRLYINTDNLDSIRTLPISSVTEKLPFTRVIGGRSVRDIDLTLSLLPATPAYLLPYLSEYWPYWGGNRVPYVGRWEISYWALVGDCWQEHHYSGKITPANIAGIPPHLAADIDYNGVPSAFWNYQLELSK
jgi:hypothetical protein